MMCHVIEINSYCITFLKFDAFDSNFYLSARNIPNVDVITVKEINPVILLRADKVAVTAEAFKLIEEWI